MQISTVVRQVKNELLAQMEKMGHLPGSAGILKKQVKEVLQANRNVCIPSNPLADFEC